MICNATTGCTCLVCATSVQEGGACTLPSKLLTSWTSCRWIVELMPELAVVVTLEYVLAVVLELLSLFDESTRASIPAC